MLDFFFRVTPSPPPKKQKKKNANSFIGYLAVTRLNFLIMCSSYSLKAPYVVQHIRTINFAAVAPEITQSLVKCPCEFLSSQNLNFLL